MTRIDSGSNANAEYAREVQERGERSSQTQNDERLRAEENADRRRDQERIEAMRESEERPRAKEDGKGVNLDEMA